MPSVPDTLLTITASNGLLPPYSSRGITQTLKPIDAASNQRRTINGELVDLSLSKFRKYTSRISCRDQRPPAADGIWPGQSVTVNCAYLLSYATIGGSPSRGVVSGSSFTEGNYTFYRPSLSMMIKDHSGNLAEWEADVEWWIELNEI
jgi:hypothetical protein